MRQRLVIALTAFAALAHPAAANDATQARVEEAASALVRGNPDQAVAAYSDALKDAGLANDRRAAILNDRGFAYARLGQTRPALDDFNRAAQLFPEYAAVYNNRGNLLLGLGLSKEALKDFDRALLLAPGYVAAYNNRAAAYVKLGQHADAVRDFTKAIELAPANAAPLSGRGRAHLALGRPHAAIRDFSRAVSADARFAAGYRSRAEAKVEVGQHEQAIEDLSRALAFDGNNAELYVLRGHTYLATGNTVSAIKDFTRAIEIEPGSVSGYQGRGLAHGIAEAFEEASADLNRAIELDGKSAVAFAYRAYVYKQNGQTEVGQKDIQTALKLDPNRAEVHWAKGELEEGAGRNDEAIADLKQAIALKPSLKLASDALERLGAPVVQAGDKEERGLGLDKWQVVSRAGRYYAVNGDHPKLRVPLETIGEGQPRILEWDLKKPPLKGFGLLRFAGGTVPGKAGPEETELAAIVDLSANSVVTIQAHKQGAKTATWTWDEGKVTVASVDGITEEFVLRNVKKEPAAVAQQPSERRYRSAEQRSGGGAPAWAPWAQPWGGGPSAGGDRQYRQAAPRKPKTLFELMFGQ